MSLNVEDSQPLSPRSDLPEIRRALALLVEPGSVVELRALGVKLNGRSYTISGFFDDYDALAAEAEKLSGVSSGVYYTPNPVKPALLARAANRVRKITDREPLSADCDVVSRRWLLIDLDPVRPAGISSSESEHAAAILRAQEIHLALAQAGWPEPIVADSGNGAHLLYRIELAANDDGLVKRALEALAFRFDDSGVNVDQKVFNPARIWKLYGTQARKGDDTLDRPHRLARLLSVPDELTVVSVEQLAALAASIPRTEAPKRESRQGDFDVERWISEHGIEVDGPFPWQTGRKWVFRVCPWNQDHQNRSAYIVQHASGAIVAGCLDLPRFRRQ